jgi:DNA-binding NtrC family response regulator
MHFPALAAVRDAAVPPPAAASCRPRGATILIVEDEDSVRSIIGAVLRRQGYDVLEASTPGRACEIFAARPSIDLLLTDMVMPDMNGPALAQRLIGVRPELRVLFISGYATVATPAAADNHNVSFLSKPFQASVLTERVRQVLARPAAVTAAR